MRPLSLILFSCTVSHVDSSLCGWVVTQIVVFVMQPFFVIVTAVVVVGFEGVVVNRGISNISC